jgi:hypothetical protein
MNLATVSRMHGLDHRAVWFWHFYAALFYFAAATIEAANIDNQLEGET